MLRPPTEDESGAIATLMSTYAPEPVTEERVRRAFAAPGLDLARDVRVAVAEGQIVGFASIHAEDVHSWIELHGEGAEALIDWATTLARGRVYAGGWQENEEVRAVLLDKGFTLARHSYRMAIGLDAESAPEPRWPDGIAVRGFRDGEGPAVYEVHMETFEDSWEHTRQPYEEWSHWLLERPGLDPELWLLAMADAEIAGIALCRVDTDDPETGWVAILGVRRPWRRQGLGRALLLESFRRLADRGCTRAVLGVDASSLTGAQLLYENVGMSVISTFDIYELPA
jgi:ribosomal protein S18 acetylase RimI-like enzyme